MSAVAVLADTDADAVVYSSGRPRDLAAKLFGRELDDLSAGTALRCDDHVAALYTSWVLHQRGPATSAVSQHRILKRASQAKSWHVSGPVHTRVKSTTICRVHYSTSGRAPRQPSGEALLTSRGITYRTCHRPLQCASTTTSTRNLTTASHTADICSTWARDCRCGSTNKNRKLVSISVLQGPLSSRRRSMFLNTTPMMALHSVSSAQIRANRACDRAQDHLMLVGNRLPTWSNDACRPETLAISRI